MQTKNYYRKNKRKYFFGLKTLSRALSWTETVYDIELSASSSSFRVSLRVYMCGLMAINFGLKLHFAMQ